jgi:glyoxylase-like metal-dependent hydrolase (beta-lactamase superfamily II)
VDVEEVRPHLWRWTARHPDWTPDEGGPDGWEREVASYALVEGGSLVLFDPLVPTDAADAERFWRALDRDVEAHGAPHVLPTVFWHARSSRAIADRYPATRVWAHEPAVADLRERTSVTDTFAAGDALPGDVEALATERAAEVVYWLPGHRALVAGDVLLGTPDGGVRVCPDSWLGDRTTPEELREELRRVLDRPVEMLLLTHGEPVLEGAREALDRALA